MWSIEKRKTSPLHETPSVSSSIPFIRTLLIIFQWQYHIGTDGIGFQHKKISIHDVDHVAINQLTQWVYNTAVKEGMSNKFFQITRVYAQVKSPALLHKASCWPRGPLVTPARWVMPHHFWGISTQVLKDKCSDTSIS